MRDGRAEPNGDRMCQVLERTPSLVLPMQPTRHCRSGLLPLSTGSPNGAMCECWSA